MSSTEMDNKMATRRLIRLSQLPERLAKEKLEDSDWVTFAVLVSKATPQSNSSVCLIYINFLSVRCLFHEMKTFCLCRLLKSSSFSRARPSAFGS